MDKRYAVSSFGFIQRISPLAELSGSLTILKLRATVCVGCSMVVQRLSCEANLYGLTLQRKFYESVLSIMFS